MRIVPASTEHASCPPLYEVSRLDLIRLVHHAGLDLKASMGSEDALHNISASDATGRVVLMPGETYCGVAGCIAGWACIEFGVPGDPITPCIAAGLLGLNKSQTEHLFFPYNHTFWPDEARLHDYASCTRQQAATAIRNLIAEDGGGTLGGAF